MKPWVDMADKQTKALHSGKAISFLNPSAILDKLCFTFFSKVSQTRLSSCLYPGNHFPLNYLLPMPPAARQVSPRPGLWLGPHKFSLLALFVSL